MKKFFTSAVFVSLFGLYALYQYSATASTLSATAATFPAAQPPAAETSGRPQASGAGDPVAVNTASSREEASEGSDGGEREDGAASAPSPASAPKPAPAPAPAPAPKPKGQYTDGSYTGSTADAYYGYIQVRATVSGGKLTDVQFLQYPSDRSTSRFINDQAMPILKSQAVLAQSARVDGVSGATDTSDAFRQSLGSALAEAKA